MCIESILREKKEDCLGLFKEEVGRIKEKIIFVASTPYYHENDLYLYSSVWLFVYCV